LFILISTLLSTLLRQINPGIFSIITGCFASISLWKKVKKILHKINACESGALSSYRLLAYGLVNYRAPKGSGLQFQ
jgi:hypothetical protein